MRDHNNERGPRPMPAWRDYSGARGPASTIESQRRSELAQIARGIFRNEIFTDRHCLTPMEIKNSFMVLSLMGHEALTKVAATLDGHGMIYEHMREALDRSINGMPMFFSLHLLNPYEAGIVHDMVVALFEAEEKALA